MRALVTFGANEMVAQLINYFSRNIDTVLVGVRFGLTELGFYSRAYSLVRLPINQISNPAATVALPVLSRLQDDPERFRVYVLRGQSVLVHLMALLFGFLAAQADPIVALTLGSQWSPIVPFLVVLAVGGVFEVASSAAQWVITARGRAGSYLRLMLFTRTLMIGLIVLGSVWGTIGVAVAYSLSCVLICVVAILWAGRVAGAPVGALLGNIATVVLGYATCSVASYAVSLAVPTGDDLLRIAVGAAVMALSLGVLCWCWARFRRDLTDAVGVLEMVFPRQAIPTEERYRILDGAMTTGNDKRHRPGADRATPEVSVVVAVHNGGQYLDSLHRQLSDLELIDRIEVILVDDGSTDGSSNRLRLMANDLPNGRYLPTGANVGVAQARNLGIGCASADYVWFIDCDDTWDRSILRRLLDRITTTDADLAMCSADLVAESGALLRRLDRVPNDETISGAELLDRVLTGSVNGYLWNKLFRRTLLPVDCFPRMSSQSDLAGFIGMLPRIERAELIADPLYLHVVRAGSITTSKNPDLENLLRSAAAMDRALDELGVDRTSWAARYFYTKSVRYSICNTGYRLSSQDRSTVEVQERARRGIELLDVVAVARHSLPEGLAVATLRYCGPLYQVLLRRRWQRLGRKYFAAA